MATRNAKIVAAHIKKAFESDNPNLLFLPAEDDFNVIFAMAVGLPHPYLSGEIILKLTLSGAFPQVPPELRCLTENGVYMVGGKICISVGEFHTNDVRKNGQGDWGWRPALGLRGFAIEALNGILAPNSLNASKHPDSKLGGIGILDTSPAHRAALAAASSDYNAAHNAALMESFMDYATANPTLAASQAWLRQRAAHALAESEHPVTREAAEKALGKDVTDLIADDDRLAQLARPMCAMDPAFRMGYAVCEGARDEDLADVAAAQFTFMAAAAPGIARFPPREARALIARIVDATMRQDFIARDLLLADLMQSGPGAAGAINPENVAPGPG